MSRSSKRTRPRPSTANKQLPAVGCQLPGGPPERSVTCLGGSEEIRVLTPPETRRLHDMSVRGQCPKCHTPLWDGDLRVSPIICPGCKTELQVFLKSNWAHTVVSLAIGVLVAYLQGLESIIFGICALFYGMVILLAIKFYRWQLHLPIKIVEKPDQGMFRTYIL